ncbi:MAG: DUF4347 domain-containing protein [Cyanobacteria bacterium J06560_2]
MPSSVYPRLQSSVSETCTHSVSARLAIFDSRVDNLSDLVAGLQPGVQAHILDPKQDGIEQISALLHPSSANEITLVAHGFPSGLHLGSSTLTLNNLSAYEHQLRKWFRGAASPRLTLLASGVAKGKAGGDFIQQLTALTGAIVRASAQSIGQGHWLTATAKTFKPVVLNTYRATL